MDKTQLGRVVAADVGLQTFQGFGHGLCSEVEDGCSLLPEGVQFLCDGWSHVLAMAVEDEYPIATARWSRETLAVEVDELEQGILVQVVEVIAKGHFGMLMGKEIGDDVVLTIII